MSRRALGILATAAIFLLGAVLFLSGRETGNAGSSLSPGPKGLIAARLYLESRGAEVALLDQPLAASELEGRTLIVAGPFQRAFDDESMAAVTAHLRRGGRVVYGYSTLLAEGYEGRLREALGLGEPIALREDPPLAPLAWRSFRAEIFELSAEPASPLRQPLEIAAFDRAPAPPAGEGVQVLYRGSDKLAPVVFEYPHQRGTVLALPAALLSNAELHRAGNAGLLELLLAGGSPSFVFDEQRHGLARIEEAAPGARLGWNLFLLQALLLYLAGAFALGRSFGPAWAEQIPALGSTAAFFEQLGSLHQRYRHFASAARSLVERARALDPQVPAELADREVKTGDDFLKLAREVASHQLSRRRET